MGQFKPMVKMMTTEPSIELKLKKGGEVKKAGGGMMGASMAPAMPARGGMMAAKRPMRPSMAARRRAMAVPPAVSMPAMKKGGEMESPATHKAEMSKMKGLEKELKSHESKPASKAHKGLATGGVVMGQGGFKAGGVIGVKASEKGAKGYENTKMHDAGTEHKTPKKTGDVKLGNAGGYKMGGNVRKYAKGGGVEGNVSTTPAGKSNTKTGEVKLGNAGGYKKGGAAKKAFATGGAVNDSGKPVAYPKKPASTPVSISKLSGTFKKGGKVQRYEGGGKVTDEERKTFDLSKGAYDRHYAQEKAENEATREMVLGFPKRVYEGVKGLLKGQGTISDGDKARGQSVTKTRESVTVAPAKKRGGAVKC